MTKQTFVMQNGLTVFLEHKPRGLSYVYLEINAGRLHEQIPEVAHTLEHVASVGAHVYGEKGALNYASANAVTKAQNTLYYFNHVLPEHVALATRNLAQVLLPPDITILEREKDAVRHELKPQVVPLAEFDEKVMRVLFPRSLKKVPRIRARLASVDTLTEENILDFWMEQYSPANAFLYIGGELPLSSPQDTFD